jgi:DNA adenine methylase
MPRHITPLRYPGGKQRLAPFIAELIVTNGMTGCHYAEPFAGGAGVALELLLKDFVSHVHLNDASQHIYALWRAIVSEPEDFCRRIAEVSLSIEDWKAHREVVRNPESYDEFQVGFSTFYLNRCNRSGVLTGGVIGGLQQTGRWRIDARFPRNELIRRVELIATKADRISVTCLDAEDFIVRHSPRTLPKYSVVYCDPPYYERSARLYLNWYAEDDHLRLAEAIQSKLASRWIVSYDDHPDLIALYAKRRKFLYPLQYSATRAYTGNEVFIFSDDWTLPRRSSVRAVDRALAGVARRCEVRTDQGFT